MQNDAPQHNDNVPANGTSDTQPEKERMPDSDAVGSDGGNQDVEKVAKSQDDTEEKFVSENPDSQDKQVQSAADTQPKTGVFGEKYFDGTGEITALVIGGETIDLTKANEPVSRNHPGLMSDFDKVMVSQNQYKNLIYGAVKLKDGSYTLFVQGQPTENNLPEGKAKYQGKVLHFRSRNVTDETDWLEEGNSYRTTGTFAAEVDFGQKSVKGTINSGDGLYMGTRELLPRLREVALKANGIQKNKEMLKGSFMALMEMKWRADTVSIKPLIKMMVLATTASAYLQAKKKQTSVDIYPVFHSREQWRFLPTGHRATP